MSRIATVTFSLTLAATCAPVQPPVMAQQYVAPQQSSVQHHTANGCKGEYETMDLPGGHIDAYPGWPPRAQPEHIVVHYDNGAVIWAKPSYGAPQCGHFATCRRATFIVNPAYTQCIAQGHLYEVITLDGKSVLDSRLLQIIDRTTSGTVDVAFTCGRGFAGPDFPSVGARISQAGCTLGSIKHGAPLSAIPTASTSQERPYAKGMTLAAAAILGVAYFGCRGAAVRPRPSPVTCTTNQLGMRAWTTTCR